MEIKQFASKRKALDVITVVMAILQALSAIFTPKVSDVRAVSVAVGAAEPINEFSPAEVDPNLP